MYLDKFCEEGTRVTLLRPSQPDNLHSLKLRRCHLTYTKGNPTSVSSLKKLDLASFSTAVWLQSDDDGEAADSSLLVSHLAMAQAVRGLPKAVVPRLVSEVSSPEMKALIVARSESLPSHAQCHS
ncbi:MAG: hypothetical protein SGPRY_014867 [Prymnesium sp.]